MANASASSPETPLLTYKNVLDKPELKTTLPDHKIAYGKDPLQYGELWLPPAASTSPSNAPLPVVVLIHGGCWLAELPGPELVAFLADDLRKHGVAVWSLTYRRLGHAGGGYPGTFQDIANGLDHLRTLAGKYNLDLNRVVTTGHSAGGHLALWVAGQQKIAAGSVLEHASKVKVKAVVGIAAISDLAYYAKVGKEACGDQSVERLIDTATRSKAGDAAAPFRDTSPFDMLPLGVKQILMQGARDHIVPLEVGRRYQSRAKEKGETVEMITRDDAGHYELISPWTPAGKAVVAKILEAVK